MTFGLHARFDRLLNPESCKATRTLPPRGRAGLGWGWFVRGVCESGFASTSVLAVRGSDFRRVADGGVGGPPCMLLVHRPVGNLEWPPRTPISVGARPPFAPRNEGLTRTMAWERKVTSFRH
jgi:hypothetical protein